MAMRMDSRVDVAEGDEPDVLATGIARGMVVSHAAEADDGAGDFSHAGKYIPGPGPVQGHVWPHPMGIRSVFWGVGAKIPLSLIPRWIAPLWERGGAKRRGENAALKRCISRSPPPGSAGSPLPEGAIVSTFRMERSFSKPTPKTDRIHPMACFPLRGGAERFIIQTGKRPSFNIKTSCGAVWT